MSIHASLLFGRWGHDALQIASLLTNRVPSLPGGAEVLELGATDTKTLYYLPAANVRRVILSTIKDLDQASSQATPRAPLPPPEQSES